LIVAGPPPVAGSVLCWVGGHTTAGSSSGVVLPEQDLVHANLDLANLLVDPSGGLVLVDVDNVGAGSRAYDAVGLMLTAAASERSTPEAEQILRDYAIDLAGPGALAVCAVSTALSMPETFIRRGRLGEAATASTGIERILHQTARPPG
jgi:hypothetical protein